MLVVVISANLHFHCSHLSPIHLYEAVSSVSVACATFSASFVPCVFSDISRMFSPGHT